MDIVEILLLQVLRARGVAAGIFKRLIAPGIASGI